jgi:hypothetical protein
MVTKLRPPTEWEKIFASYKDLPIWQGFDNQNIEGAQKTKLSKIQ